MRNNIYNYVASFSSLIDRPLRRSVQGSVCYPTSSSISFYEGKGAVLQYYTKLRLFHFSYRIYVSKQRLFNLSFPFGGQGAAIDHSR